MEDIKQLLTVLFFLALTLSQDLDEFDDPNSAMFKSNTKCNFSTRSSHRNATLSSKLWGTRIITMMGMWGMGERKRIMLEAWIP